MTDQTTVKALIAELRFVANEIYWQNCKDSEKLDRISDALEASLVDSKTLEIDANKAGCVPPAPLSTDSSQPRGGSNERGPDDGTARDEKRYRDWRDDRVESHGVKAAFMAGIQYERHDARHLHAVPQSTIPNAAEIAEAKLAIPDDVRSALEWCSARENPDQFSDFDEVIVRDWLASHPSEDK